MPSNQTTRQELEMLPFHGGEEFRAVRAQRSFSEQPAW
jgi:hypothetical protein